MAFIFSKFTVMLNLSISLTFFILNTLFDKSYKRIKLHAHYACVYICVSVCVNVCVFLLFCSLFEGDFIFYRKKTFVL